MALGEGGLRLGVFRQATLGAPFSKSPKATGGVRLLGGRGELLEGGASCFADEDASAHRDCLAVHFVAADHPACSTLGGRVVEVDLSGLARSLENSLYD